MACVYLELKECKQVVTCANLDAFSYEDLIEWKERYNKIYWKDAKVLT